MASPYAPINAGQLLFGPVTKVLRSMTQERRARQEREGVRAENRRRYEAGLELEAARYADIQERQSELDRQAAFGLAQETIQTAQDPSQIVSAVEELRRRGYAPAMEPGTLEASRMPARPTYRLEDRPYTIPAVAEPMGPPAAFAPVEAGGVTPIEAVEFESLRRPPIPVQQGSRLEDVFDPLSGPAYDVPPTQPLARKAATALQARRDREEDKLRRASGRTAAGHLREALMADPTGEGAGLIFQMDTKGAPPVSEDAVVISVKRGLAAMREQQLKRARAGRTVRGPQPEAASRRLTPALKRGDRAGFVRVYSSVYGETDPADVGRMFDQYLSDRIEDAIAKAEARANDKRFSKKHTRLAQIRQLLKNTYDPRVRAPYEEEAASLVSDIEDMDARLSYSGLPKRLVAAAMGDVDGGSDASKEFMQKFHDFDTQVEAMEFISKFAASPGWKSISPSVQSLLRRASRLPPERRREVISGFLKP
tara:strand:+ start:1205 stop:2647 length:1443 start_codon:yes stop_codon:yes gene_type:complete